MSDGARTGSTAIRLVVAWCLLASVMAGALSATPAVAQPANDSIEGIDLSGAAVVPTEGNTTYLWQDEPLNMSVRLANNHDNTTRNYGVCPYQVGTNERLLVEKRDDCLTPTLDPGTTRTVSFSGIEWPAEALRGQQVRVDLELVSPGGDGGVLAQQSLPVTVITKGGDIDNDGLVNSRDVFVGLDDDDVDDDGLSDGDEVSNNATEPDVADTDGDGLLDGAEVNRYGTDPDDPDTDGDGLDDGFEVNTLGTDPTSRLTPVWLALTALAVVGLVIVVAMVIRRWRHTRREGAATRSPSATREETARNTSSQPGADDHDSGERVAGDERRRADVPNGPGAIESRNDRSGGEHDGPSGPTIGPEPRGERSTTGSVTGPLTDEDRVCELLRERGGRAKQATIVAETEWSKAKVSRLLSSMDEEGLVEKLSIGRENVISLAGHGPETTQSPREE